VFDHPRMTMQGPLRFVAILLTASLVGACTEEVDAQCLADLQAHYGASCENGSECDRPLICGSLGSGDPNVCHAAIRCESSDECRGVRLCGVATVCIPTNTGMNACLPMAFGDASTEMDVIDEGTDAH
jgi:hypothetical protein